MKNETSNMLRHMAEQIENAAEDQAPCAAAIIIAINEDGGWAAMTSMAVDPMAGVALLEYAKVDLMSGGARWTHFKPKEEPANQPN